MNIKRIFTILLCLALSYQVLFAFIGSGSGTSGDPYLVSTAAEFNDVRNDLTAYYKQTADISLSSYSNWTAIGVFSTSPFSGTYDGDYHKITGLTISTSTQYYGLFCIFNRNY
jgi:hypothetical protein